MYVKTASLAESHVFAYLKSMYETLVNSDAYSNSEYDDNIKLHAVFGYVIFARQSNVPVTLMELLTLIRENEDGQTSDVEAVQAASNTIAPQSKSTANSVMTFRILPSISRTRSLCSILCRIQSCSLLNTSRMLAYSWSQLMCRPSSGVFSTPRSPK